jgi:hypothetical protein
MAEIPALGQRVEDDRGDDQQHALLGLGYPDRVAMGERDQRNRAEETSRLNR